MRMAGFWKGDLREVRVLVGDGGLSFGAFNWPHHYQRCKNLVKEQFNIGLMANTRGGCQVINLYSDEINRGYAKYV